METFDSLQELWNQQSVAITKPSAGELMRKGQAHIKKIKASQVATTGILAALIITLVAYFISMEAHKLNELTIGLTIMIGVMLTRVALEVISIKKFAAIVPDISLVEYSIRMQEYYSWRKRIHLVFIPIIYITYMFGFTLLLPAFKANLSFGMYWYVVISGYGFLTFFALMLVRILRKERGILNALKEIDQLN